MKSNYEPLGKHIRLVDYRNSEEVTSTVLGISIDKEFMPSVANVIGTDLSRYKLISKGLFACNPMHVGRDERLPIALYEKDNAAIVSPAYFMFEIIDRDVLNEEYLMMWFRRPEFDRECWFMTDGSVRGGISWDDLCRIQLPVPPYERQLDVVESYRAITRRIAMKKEINDNLAVLKFDGGYIQFAGHQFGQKRIPDFSKFDIFVFVYPNLLKNRGNSFRKSAHYCFVRNDDLCFAKIRDSELLLSCSRSGNVKLTQVQI